MSHTNLVHDRSLAPRRRTNHHAGGRLPRRIAMPFILALSLGLWMVVWKLAALVTTVLFVA